MNFFEWVQLINKGLIPKVSKEEWLRYRGALVQLSLAHKGANNLDSAEAIDSYIEVTDKEHGYASTVE